MTLADLIRDADALIKRNYARDSHGRFASTGAGGGWSALTPAGGQSGTMSARIEASTEPPRGPSIYINGKFHSMKATARLQEMPFHGGIAREMGYAGVVDAMDAGAVRVRVHNEVDLEANSMSSIRPIVHHFLGMPDKTHIFWDTSEQHGDAYVSEIKEAGGRIPEKRSRAGMGGWQATRIRGAAKKAEAILLWKRAYARDAHGRFASTGSGGAGWSKLTPGTSGADADAGYISSKLVEKDRPPDGASFYRNGKYITNEFNMEGNFVLHDMIARKMGYGDETDAVDRGLVRLRVLRSHGKDAPPGNAWSEDEVDIQARDEPTMRPVLRHVMMLGMSGTAKVFWETNSDSGVDTMGDLIDRRGRLQPKRNRPLGVLAARDVLVELAKRAYARDAHGRFASTGGSGGGSDWEQARAPGTTREARSKLVTKTSPPAGASWFKDGTFTTTQANLDGEFVIHDDVAYVMGYRRSSTGKDPMDVAIDDGCVRVRRSYITGAGGEVDLEARDIATLKPVAPALIGLHPETTVYWYTRGKTGLSTFGGQAGETTVAGIIENGRRLPVKERQRVAAARDTIPTLLRDVAALFKRGYARDARGRFAHSGGGGSGWSELAPAGGATAAPVRAPAFGSVEDHHAAAERARSKGFTVGTKTPVMTDTPGQMWATSQFHSTLTGDVISHSRPNYTHDQIGQAMYGTDIPSGAATAMQHGWVRVNASRKQISLEGEKAASLRKVAKKIAAEHHLAANASIYWQVIGGGSGVTVPPEIDEVIKSASVGMLLSEIADLFKRAYARDAHGRFASTGSGGAASAAPASTQHIPGIAGGAAMIVKLKQAHDEMAAGHVIDVDESEVATHLKYLRQDSPVNLANMNVTGPGNANLYTVHLTDNERAKMPQLPEDAAGLSRFKEHCAKSGVKTQMMEIDPRQLKASQKELDSTKVAAVHDYLETHGGKLKKEGEVLVVSNDLGVLDGHHRWAAVSAYTVGHPLTRVKVLMVDKDIHSTLRIAGEFDEAEGIKPAGFADAMTGAGARAAQAEARQQRRQSAPIRIRSHKSLFTKADGFEIPDNFEPIDMSPPTRPCPDPSQPYIWLHGQWLLVVMDSLDDRDYPVLGTPLTEATEAAEAFVLQSDSSTVAGYRTGSQPLPQPSRVLEAAELTLSMLAKRAYARDAHGRFARTGSTYAKMTQTQVQAALTKKYPDVEFIGFEHADRRDIRQLAESVDFVADRHPNVLNPDRGGLKIVRVTPDAPSMGGAGPTAFGATNMVKEDHEMRINGSYFQPGGASKYIWMQRCAEDEVATQYKRPRFFIQNAGNRATLMQYTVVHEMGHVVESLAKDDASRRAIRGDRTMLGEYDKFRGVTRKQIKKAGREISGYGRADGENELWAEGFTQYHIGRRPSRYARDQDAFLRKYGLRTGSTAKMKRLED